MSEFHTEAPQATVSKGLAQGPYVTARAGFEPATLWKKALNLPMSNNAPPLITRTLEKLINAYKNNLPRNTSELIETRSKGSLQTSQL